MRTYSLTTTLLCTIALLPATALGQCESFEANDNQAFEIGSIRVVEPLEFTYSSFNEPELLFIEDGGANGAVFSAIKRAMKSIQSAIEMDKIHGKGKQNELFSLKETDQPFHPTQETGLGSLWHYPYVDNNYASALYSGDGINSIGWVDFGEDAGPLTSFIRENFGAITFTVWNESREIIERDILLQANEFQNWAVLADLTSNGDAPNDCSLTLDVQGVMTHMLAHAVGLRPVQPDGDPANGTEETSTMWDPWGDPSLGLSGRVVLSNLLGMPTHHWQTLTPGDGQGLAMAAPDKKARFTPNPEPVTPEPAQVVLHYDFEDLSSGFALDRSGNLLDRPVVGAAQHVPGPHGMAIDLSAGQYIDLDGAAFPRGKIPTDTYTLAAWLNVPLAAVALEPSIFTTINSTGIVNHQHYFFPEVFVVSANASTGTNIGVPIVTNPFLPAGIPEGWFHYAVSWDRATGEAILYINGSVAGVMTLEDAPLDTNWAGGAYIGSWTVDSPFRLHGAMDDFVLTNYVMTAGEISELMAGNQP